MSVSETTEAYYSNNNKKSDLFVVKSTEIIIMRSIVMYIKKDLDSIIKDYKLKKKFLLYIKNEKKSSLCKIKKHHLSKLRASPPVVKL